MSKWHFLTITIRGNLMRFVYIVVLFLFSVLFFSCSNNNPPLEPDQPSPSENSVVLTDVNFAWACTDPDGDPLTYDLYLDKVRVATGLTHPSYTMKLTPGTTYTWWVVAKDTSGETTPGPVWKFTTSSTSSNR
jgi:hypothetical protein